MATKNIENFKLPTTSNYDSQDAYEYYANEKGYASDPDKTLDRKTERSIADIKARSIALGISGLQAAMFDAA